MKRTVINSMLLFLIGTSSQVFADTTTVQPNLDNTDDTVVSDYAAKGFRLGSFVAKPTLEVGTNWNSNIYNSDSKVRPDVNAFVTHVKPTLNVDSNWSRHAINLNVQSDIMNYIDHPSEDRQLVNVDLNGRLDVLRDSFAFARFGFINQPEQRGAPDSAVNATKPTGHQTLLGQIGYDHKINRIHLDVNHLIAHDQFQNGTTGAGTVIPNDQNRSRMTNTSTAKIGYELAQGYEAFVKGSYNFINYDSQFNQQGYERSSDGYKVVTGVAVDLTGKLKGDARIGYQSQTYKDARLGTVDGVAGGMTLKWTPTGLTTVTADVDRTINETTQLASGTANVAYSSVLATAALVKVEHELLRNVLLSANTGYTYNQYQGNNLGNVAARTDDIYSAGTTAKYLINRNFFADLSYLYGHRSTQNVQGVNYDNHTVYLGVGTQY